MDNKFIEIYDPKKRNELVEEHLRLRKKLKNRFAEEENIQNDVIQNRVELFKPIIESNQKIQNEIIEDRNKIIDTFKQLKIKDKPNEKHRAIEYVAPTSSSIDSENDYHDDEFRTENTYNFETILVSVLIRNYLCYNGKDRSKNGYSIRWDEEKKCFTIGNKTVYINDNILILNNKNYNATNGLMELLIVNTPNFMIITNEDKQNYKQILIDSNGIYQKPFNPDISKKKNSGSGAKWKFIKNELLKELWGD